MKKSDEQELNELFLSVAKLFKSRCHICHEPCSSASGFVFHHREYRQGEKTHGDFKLQNGKSDRLAYHRYLVPIIKIHHKHFRLIHNSHHHIATQFAGIKPPKFERMVKMSREINRLKFHTM